MNSSFESALQRWRDAIGSQHVLTDPDALAGYGLNVSALNRSIPAVLMPGSTDEVQNIVRTANDTGVPLYPISKGKNWGMGSKLPVRDNCVIVDLGRMNTIRSIHRSELVAVVEPGVTQGALHERIRADKLPAVLNVIGSGKDTSLIGNALDRGVGYFAGRADSLSGLEIVLGNGEILKTGFSHFPDARTSRVYRHGVGPSLDGLFAQSNYGIVTAAAVELMPWTDHHVSLIAKIDQADKLPQLVDILAELRRRDIIRMVVHIGNRHRSFSTLAPLVYEQLRRLDPEAADTALRASAVSLLEQEGFGPWSAIASINGTREAIREAEKEFRKALRPLATVSRLDPSKLPSIESHLRRLSWIPPLRRKALVLQAMKPIIGLSMGIPTDEALKSVYWSAGGSLPSPGQTPDPDQTDGGLLYCLPIIPLTGEDARLTVETTESIFHEFGFVPFITLNILDVRAMEVVISLSFNRQSPDELQKAHSCIRTLQDRLLSQGYPPYRIGIHDMEWLTSKGDPVFWKTAQQLKSVLDPKHIISPGRYSRA